MTRKPAGPPLSLPTFTWSQLLVFFGVVLVLSSLGSILARNGPLTSPAWHRFITQQCGNPTGAANGAVYGPIKDVIRFMLAVTLSAFAFYRLAIIPTKDADSPGRSLNWLPVLLPKTSRLLRQTTSTFEAQFSFEKWILAGFLVVALISIALYLPLEALDFFLAHSGANLKAPVGILSRIASLYSDEFSNITRPYLFPYSFYILGLWYCVVLTTWLALIRSIKYDLLNYSRLLAALDLSDATTVGGLPRNIVGIYERKSLDCFDFIDTMGKRYGLLLLGLFGLLYIQRTLLSCSILAGGDQGKAFLLLFVGTGLWIVLFGYLRLYSEARNRAQSGIGRISDALEQEPTREAELRDATALSEMIRNRDGVNQLKTVVTGTGVIAVVGGLLWTYVLKKNFCVVAYSIFPDWLVQRAAELFQMNCPNDH